MRRMLLCPLALALLVATAHADAPLRWKWKEKETFYVQMTTRYADVVRLGEMETKSKNEVSATFRVTVRKVQPDGGAVLEMHIDSCKAEEKRANDRLFSKLAGQTLVVTLDGKADVAKVEGTDEVVKKLVPTGDQEPPPAAAKAFRDFFDAFFRYWFGEVFIALPGKAVKKGDSWEQKTTQTFQPLGQLITNKKFTDEGPATVDGREVRKAGIVGRLDFKAGGAGGALFSFKIDKVTIKKQDFKGFLHLDPKTGRPLRSEYRPKLATTITVTADDKTVEGESERDQTFVVRFLDKKPEAP